MKFLSNFSTKESKLHIVFLILHLSILFLDEIFNFSNIIIVGGLGLCTIGYLVYDILHNRTMFKTKYYWLLILFLVSNGISIVANMKYGVFDNVISIMGLVIDYCILYNFEGQTKDEVKSSFKIISNFIIIAFTFGAIMSLVTYCLSVSRVIPRVDQYAIHRGFINNRLWGIWPDPNFYCIRCLVVIMLIIYNIATCKDKLTKVLYYIAIAFNFSYVILSGSRAGQLSLYSAIVIGSIIAVNKLYEHKNKLFKQLVAIACAFVFCISTYGTMELAKQGLSYLPGITAQFLPAEDEEDKPIAQTNLTRSDVANTDDISNNRFEIWGSAFEILGTTPLFGTSQRNFTAYAEDVLPETYMAVTGYHTHNSFIELFMVGGIVGGSILTLFFVLCAIRALKFLFTCDKERFFEPFVSTMSIVIILVSSMTLHDLFFMRNGYNTLLWLSMGYTMYFCKTHNKTENK